MHKSVEQALAATLAFLAATLAVLALLACHNQLVPLGHQPAPSQPVWDPAVAVAVVVSAMLLAAPASIVLGQLPLLAWGVGLAVDRRFQALSFALLCPHLSEWDQGVVHFPCLLCQDLSEREQVAVDLLYQDLSEREVVHRPYQDLFQLKRGVVVDLLCQDLSEREQVAVHLLYQDLSEREVVHLAENPLFVLGLQE